jgi:dolichyl-phosphate-mannose--protein O-mannosyl transferase
VTRRRDLLVAALLALLAAAFRLPRLGFPPEEVFDEVYHAKTALEYLQGKPPTEWVHPPTAKLLIAIGVHLFGYEPWAWRLLPALAGVALAPVFYLLARRVLRTERAAILAAILLLCDGVYLVQSRTAMTNIFAVLFQVGAALFVVRSVLEERLPVGSMLAAGLFLGLALSTRWTSLWAAGFLGLVVLVARGRRLLAAREVALVLAAFAVVPAILYALSYVPWMLQGHSAREVVELQGSIWQYHANLRAEHPYFSSWYTWPWLHRPTWYYYQQEGETVRGIVALGNPALWWASVPASLWVLRSGLLRRDPRRLFAAFGFLCLYLPWGISPRTLNYSHYLFEAIPYTCLALAMLMDESWDGRFGSIPRAYLLVVVALFLFFLPILIALPIPTSAFFRKLPGNMRPWTWLPSWV